MKWSRNEPFIISLRESGAGSIIAALSASGSEASFIKIISGGNPLPLGGGRSHRYITIPDSLYNAGS